MTADKPIPLSGVKPSRRRQFYIKKPFQFRFISQFCSLIILAGLLIAVALYVYSNQTLTTAFIDSRLRIMSTGDFLLPALGIIALLVTAFVTAVAAFRILLFSHKIAGPLYRLEKSAQQIGQGDFSFHVRLRSKDELQDLAKAIEKMIEDLRPKIQAIKGETERLGELVNRIDSQSVNPEQLMSELKSIYSKLEEQISQFRG